MGTLSVLISLQLWTFLWKQVFKNAVYVETVTPEVFDSLTGVEVSCCAD